MEGKVHLPMHYGAKGRLFEFAKEMRKNPTDSERALWKVLNGDPFSQYKFRRQHPIARYIADFYSHQLKLVIEVDGGYHLNLEQMEIDELRDEDMSEFSIIIMRFTNEDILNRLAEITTEIFQKIVFMKSLQS